MISTSPLKTIRNNIILMNLQDLHGSDKGYYVNQGTPTLGVGGGSPRGIPFKARTAGLRLFPFDNRTYKVYGYVQMALTKRFELRTSEEEYAAWSACAEKAGLALGEWVRKQCNAVQAEFHAAEVPETVLPAHSGEVVREVPKPKVDELSEAVAERTKHAIGCTCYQCTQTRRFFAGRRRGDGG